MDINRVLATQPQSTERPTFSRSHKFCSLKNKEFSDRIKRCALVLLYSHTQWDKEIALYQLKSRTDCRSKRRQDLAANV